MPSGPSSLRLHQVWQALSRGRVGSLLEGLPFRLAVAPVTKPMQQLLRKFVSEPMAEYRQWEARKEEQHIYALKRARVMGWTRVEGSDLNLERLRDLPPERWETGHPNDLGGYQYLTEVTIIDRVVDTMLDTGAACNTIPEELVIGMMNRCATLGIPPDSPEYPIVALEKWKCVEHVEGVAAGRPVNLLGSVVIKVLLGYDRNGMKPVQPDVRCKIFEAGTASFMGIILGGRTLDAVPQGGMGLQIREKSYHLALYDIDLPRTEGPKRKRVEEATSAGIPPELMEKHCGMTVHVRTSVVDSDAEEEEGYAQFVDLQTNAAGSGRAVDSNTLVYRGSEPVPLEPQDGAWFRSAVGRRMLA